MSMFCFQCQETARNQGCTIRGVCGKQPETAKLLDLLIYVLKGISIIGEKAIKLGLSIKPEGAFIARSLFSTITKPVKYSTKNFTMLLPGHRLMSTTSRRKQKKWVSFPHLMKM